MACRAARLARGDEDEIIVVQFAPAAHVGVSQLEEINRPLLLITSAVRVCRTARGRSWTLNKSGPQLRAASAWILAH